GQGAGRHLHPRRTDVVELDQLLGALAARRPVHPGPPGIGWLRLVAEHRVLPQRGVEQQPAPVAVLGYVAEPRLAPPANRPVGDVDAVQLDATGARLAQTEQGLDELGLAVALDAGHADDLAPADRDVDAVDHGPTVRPGDGEAPDGQRHVLGGGGLAGLGAGQL